MGDRLVIIPPHRREAARAALRLVTGRPVPGPVALLKGGISGALIYRVEWSQRALALRLEPERVAPEHLLRGFACMEAAAALGVAPHLHLADPAAGIAIMDFIDAKPIATHPGGRPGVAAELGTLIARLQAAAPFPAMFGNDDDMVATALQALDASELFAPGLLHRHRDALARLRAALPWNPSALVPSHNDPNPRNLLYDGARLWLVDWELAARNDRLFDLAIATTDIADTPALETALLAAALGHPPGAPLRAPLHVVRLLTRLFYGCIALDSVKADRPPRDTSLAAMTPAQFRAAASQGRLPPGEIGWAFGKMSLAAFVEGCSASDFARSLALAGEADAWFPRPA